MSKSHRYVTPTHVQRTPPTPGRRGRVLRHVTKRVQWRGNNTLEIQSFVDTYQGVEVEFVNARDNGRVQCVIAGEVVPVGAFIHFEMVWGVGGPEERQR